VQDPDTCTLSHLTHDRYGRTTKQTNGARTHRVSSTDDPPPDGVLNKSSSMKIRCYRQICVDRPDPIVFLSITVSTSGRVYEDFSFMPLPFFFNSRQVSPLLNQSLGLNPQQSA
jgi:hypothetical protein